MAKKISRSAEHWPYILTSDRELPADQQSKFWLKPLTQGERAHVFDDIAHVIIQKDGSKRVISRNRAQAIEIVLSNIESIDNFPAGDPQPWPKGKDERRKYLEMLDDDFVAELGGEIYEKSAIGIAVKNS